MLFYMFCFCFLFFELDSELSLNILVDGEMRKLLIYLVYGRIIIMLGIIIFLVWICRFFL